MYSAQSIVLLILALATSACGNALTEEQKSQVRDLNSKVDQTLESPRYASNSNSEEHESIEGWDDGIAIDESRDLSDCVIESEGDSDIPSPGDDISDSLDGGFSSSPIVRPNPWDEIDKGYRLRVSGSRCPVSMTLRSWVDPHPALDAYFKVNYKVHDRAFFEYSDITAMDFEASLTSAGGTTRFLANGSVHSQVHGKVELGGNGELSSSGGTFNLKLKFPKFTAHFVIQVNSQGKSTFHLNSEEITESEFQDYVGSFSVQ